MGLAQFRKLDQFLDIQKRNHAILKEVLSVIPEITWRRIPDPSGDSCTFLSWFLPTEAILRDVLEGFKSMGIAGGQMYWYEHNWHYIRKWAHVKEGQSLNRLNKKQRTALERLSDQDFSASDRVISRCLSTAIQLTWTPEQTRERGEKMVVAIQAVLAKHGATV